MSGEAATLIGDIVGSRTAADRAALHDRIEEALVHLNGHHQPTTPLRITVGDEYQGAFRTVAGAARAALHLRVALLPHRDVRHGLGWGGVTVLQQDPRVEDGPGWWSARDALHAVEEAEHRSATAWRRTALRLASPRAVGDPHGMATADQPVDPTWAEATLMMLDQLVGGLSPRSVSVLRGLLEGQTQREIADELGVSPSAVSQRVRHDGLVAILAVDSLLEEAS